MFCLASDHIVLLTPYTSFELNSPPTTDHIRDQVLNPVHGLQQLFIRTHTDSTLINSPLTFRYFTFTNINLQLPSFTLPTKFWNEPAQLFRVCHQYRIIATKRQINYPDIPVRTLQIIEILRYELNMELCKLHRWQKIVLRPHGYALGVLQLDRGDQKIIFMVERWFYLRPRPDQQNTRIWSAKNPNQFDDCMHAWSKQLKLWCAGAAFSHRWWEDFAFLLVCCRCCFC